MKLFNIFYYLLTFTWGILTNICGVIAAMFFVPLFGADFKVIHGRFVFIGGDNWGGLSLGNFIFVSKAAMRYGTNTLNHEIGHSLQNIFWGPLFLIVIGLPSALRYWYRETNYYKKNLKLHKPYDAIWFEGQATSWGNAYVKASESEEK